ncbi:MAG: hypothetical protein JJE04_20850 [Acidobacteriia bacterium]|nr:hypothetical protein [Terriglobia bacterium]
MKSGKPAAALIILIVVLLALGVWIIDPPNLFRARGTAKTPVELAKPPEPVKEEKRRRPGAPVSTPLDLAAETTIQSPAEAPSIAKPVPFPTLEGIPIGAAKSKIKSDYGSPKLSTVTLKDGRVYETYVYRRASAGSQVIIEFRDGTIISKQQAEYGAVVAGIAGHVVTQ